MIPSDIRGEQCDVLEAVLPRIEHRALRARVADIVWTNDKRKSGVAKTAIDAYCDCVEGLMDGSLRAAYPISDRDLVGAQSWLTGRCRSHRRSPSATRRYLIV
jgi:hypothetical protein